MRNKCILDESCLVCLHPLSTIELEYWQGYISTNPEPEPTVLRVSCVSCAEKRGRHIPAELKEKMVGVVVVAK